MADGYINMLNEQRANTWEQAKALLDNAAKEKRGLDAAEQASYDKMSEDLTGLRSQIDKMTADRANADASEEALRKLSEQPKVQPGFEAPKVDMDAQLRSFLSKKSDLREFDLVGSPEDVRSVESLRAALRPGIEQRAGLSGLTAGAGGATQPTNFYNKLWAHMINASQILQSGITVLQTTDGNTIQLPTTTAHSTATWTAQQATIGESDPVFTQRSLGAYKGGVLIPVSNELIEDTGVDLEGYLAMECGRAVGNLIGQGIVVGNGTGQPTGITTLTTLGTTGSTGVVGKPNFDDMINLYYSVIPQYRAAQSAAWVTNDTTIGVLRTLKTSYGQYLWQPGLTMGTPDTILGKPVIQEVWMPATALGAKSVIFGDLSAYFARVVNGIKFEMSRDFAFNADVTTFRCLLRADGTLVDQTGAIRHFAGGAS